MPQLPDGMPSEAGSWRRGFPDSSRKVLASAIGTPSKSDSIRPLQPRPLTLEPPNLDTRESEVFSVDPDPASRRLVVQSLSDRGIGCAEFGLGQEAFEAALRSRPRMVVSEMALPDMSGLGLCRLLRESPGTERIPFMLVSARSSEIDRILAFEAGADDFVPKPFFASELGARVSAILKRSSGSALAEPLSETQSEGPIQIDARRHLVTVGGVRVELSATEFAVLDLLVGQGGRVLYRNEMVQRLWGPDAAPSERIVDSHVKSIRRKLGRARECIETVRGRGYRYDPRRA